jgi:hypothetical protein
MIESMAFSRGELLNLRFGSCVGLKEPLKILTRLLFPLQARSQRYSETRGWSQRAGCGPVRRSRHRRCPPHTFTTSRSLQVYRGLRGPVRASRQSEALARARCQGKTASQRQINSRGKAKLIQAPDKRQRAVEARAMPRSSSRSGAAGSSDKRDPRDPRDRSEFSAARQIPSRSLVPPPYRPPRFDFPS